LRTAIYGKRGFDSYALVSAEDGQDVTSGDDKVILALVVHLGAAVLGVQHLVADLDVDRDTLAGVVTTARGADRSAGRGVPVEALREVTNVGQ